uniref:ShKT domain-containing protein n=1 Tax=Meloidogyne javanica TaxID=6303 RepID=A0A915MWI2_MELJA
MNEFINNSVKLDFWKEPSNIGEDTHVMVAKGPILDDFLNRLNKYNLNIQIMIEDVNESFADIIHYLNALAVNYPNRVTVQPIGSTHEGRQIPLIKIGTNNNLIGKPAIWIDGGIHAREWVSPAVVLFMIDQLVIGYDTQPLIKQFVDQLDWFIVPLLNPDGYEYSRSSSDPEIRLWRKNRSPTQCTQINTGLFTPPNTQCCQGVDLNRNFDWFFGQVGSSSDPCSEIFAGNFAFSEPETQSVRDFISQQQGRIKTFMTFHSYSQILMYPFGHSLRTYPQDVQELSNVALRAAQALQSTYGTKYTVGTGADTLANRVCRDTDSLCLYWTQQSSSTCQQWPAMKERCSRSCNFCSVDEEN